MDLLESFVTATESLSNNKMRAILTMLGIIIGVAAVITLLALGNGVSVSIEDQIQGIGSNLITIITDYDNSEGYPALGMGDLMAIEDQFQAPAIRRAAAEAQGTQQVLYSGRDTRATVSGITANYFGVRNKAVEYGGSLTESDVNSKARVAVIGADVVEDLYPNDEFPIGTSIRIRGIQYKVIGVPS
jgi:putative ABC transport system permease protein